MASDLLIDLQNEQIEPPCLSIYMPTHRTFPDNQQDRIRYRNLLKQVEESLQSEYSAQESQELLEPFLALSDDQAFWNCTHAGLAVLGSKSVFKAIRLQAAVPELAIVADSFHLKPLRRYLQTIDRYHLLALSRDSFKLFEGNRHSLDEVEPDPSIPRSMRAALGPEQPESRIPVSTYAGPKGSQEDIHQGHGGRTEEVDKETEKFFRIVDKGVWEHHSRPTGLPLLLAALPEHHHLLRKASQNPQLLDGAVAIDPAGVPLERLKELAWERLEPRYTENCEVLAGRYNETKGTGLATDDLESIAKAATEGRVDTLLIAEDQVIPGHIEKETGSLEFREIDDPLIDDVLDDLGETVENMGGQVYVLSAEQMPGRKPVAAIFRY